MNDKIHELAKDAYRHITGVSDRQVHSLILTAGSKRILVKTEGSCSIVFTHDNDGITGIDMIFNNVFDKSQLSDVINPKLSDDEKLEILLRYA